MSSEIRKTAKGTKFMRREKNKENYKNSKKRNGRGRYKKINKNKKKSNI